MEIRLEEMREIARTLPIGYYLGRKVPVLVEPGGDAYCDVVKGEIHIGIGLLQQAADQIDAADAAQWSREKLLRCLLYHECGHVLLTPKWAKGWWNLPETPDGSRDPDGAELVNIFEDERLEQMLSQFFLGVDFKGFVRLIHKRGVKADRVGEFFKAVRLRQSTPEISAAVDAAVQKLVWCNSQSEYCEHGPNGESYRGTLTELVNMIAPYSKPEEQKQQEQQQQEQQQPQSSDEQRTPEEEQPKDKQADGGSEDKSEQGQSKDEQSKDGSESKPEDEQDSGEGSDSDKGKPEDKSEDKPEEKPEEENDKPDGEAKGREPAKVNLPGDFLKSLADKVFVTPPSDVENTLRRFAVRLSKRKGSQAAGRWSALHGKIDPRRDALDKERIFRRTSDVGASLMTSVHLTLWVDCSGSFHNSKDTLNQILAATSKAMAMSGGKLTVDVVKMNLSATVVPQRDWLIDPFGGNDIDATYTEAWRKTRRKDRRNIDLVVFDGCCAMPLYSMAQYLGAKERVDKLKAAGYNKVRVKCKGGLKGLKAKADAMASALDDVAKIATGIWDSPDCHVISDPSNKVLFDRLGKAHVTYVDGNYAEHLQEEVVKTLDRIL